MYSCIIPLHFWKLHNSTTGIPVTYIFILNTVGIILIILYRMKIYTVPYRTLFSWISSVRKRRGSSESGEESGYRYYGMNILKWWLDQIEISGIKYPISYQYRSIISMHQYQIRYRTRYKSKYRVVCVVPPFHGYREKRPSEKGDLVMKPNGAIIQSTGIGSCGCSVSLEILLWECVSSSRTRIW